LASIRAEGIKHRPPARLILPAAVRGYGMRTILVAAPLLAALAMPVLADTYPVSGRFGESATAEKNPIDCTGKRVIAFNGDQRTDSRGSVPAYRNRTVTPDGEARFRVIDAFTTGQIKDAQSIYTLTLVDANRVEIRLDQGSTIMLQRCK
jgi:hypothetical protein